MKTRIASLAVLASIVLTSPALVAHHSNVAFAVETVLEAKGTVKEWQWSNPHTWLIMTVDDGKGGKTEWAMEGRAPGVLLRAGWSPKVLKPCPIWIPDFKEDCHPLHQILNAVAPPNSPSVRTPLASARQPPGIPGFYIFLRRIVCSRGNTSL